MPSVDPVKVAFFDAKGDKISLPPNVVSTGVQKSEHPRRKIAYSIKGSRNIKSSLPKSTRSKRKNHMNSFHSINKVTDSTPKTRSEIVKEWVQKEIPK